MKLANTQEFPSPQETIANTQRLLFLGGRRVFIVFGGVDTLDAFPTRLRWAKPR